MAPITRILCPVDFSEASRHAIEHATVIARWYKASITALPMDTPFRRFRPDDRLLAFLESL